MTRPPADLRAAVDELGNALQAAILLAGLIQRSTATVTADAAALEAAIGRAMSAVRRLQPSEEGE